MAPWSLKSVHFLPLGLGVVATIGLVVPFCVAWGDNDVTPYVPFISEAGGSPPESGIFSIFLDIIATIGLVILGLRFMLVYEYNQGESRSLDIVNKVSLVAGVISLMGMIIVACYPVTTTLTAHVIGAMMMFLASNLYAGLQTWITYKTYPRFHGIRIFKVRLVIIIISCIALMTMMISGALASKVWDPAKSTGRKTPGDKGFGLLVVAATAEWTMAVMFLLYYLTYFPDFKKFGIHLTIQLLEEAAMVETSQASRSEHLGSQEQI